MVHNLDFGTYIVFYKESSIICFTYYAGPANLLAPYGTFYNLFSN